jgi:hypothetical protein
VLGSLLYLQKANGLYFVTIFIAQIPFHEDQSAEMRPVQPTTDSYSSMLLIFIAYHICIRWRKQSFILCLDKICLHKDRLEAISSQLAICLMGLAPWSNQSYAPLNVEYALCTARDEITEFHHTSYDKKEKPMLFKSMCTWQCNAMHSRHCKVTSPMHIFFS